MPETLRILGQATPGTANAAVVIYTAATGTQVVVSSIIVANTTGLEATFRAFATTGTTYDPSTALFYNVKVAPGSSAVLTLGATLGPGSRLAVASNTAGALTFTVFGQEVS